MKTVAIAMQKGGVGKTTLTRSLAVAASGAGINVLVLDMDLQQSATQWSRRREKHDQVADLEKVPVMFVTEGDLELTLEKVAQAGCDLVLIDTPPARSAEAPAAVEAADLVVIPCTPDIEAYEQLAKTVGLARRNGRPAVAVLNKATPNSRSDIEGAEAVFERNQVPMAPVVLCQRKVHRDAARAGLTAKEQAAISKGANEVAALWAWIAAELTLCTPATLQS